MCSSLLDTQRPRDQAKMQHYQAFLTPTEIIPRLVYLMLVVIATTFGNLLVIVAVARFKKLRRSTNLLLASLAMADLMVGFITVPLYILWTVNPEVFDKSSFLCRLVLLSCLLFVAASQVSLLLLSVERYLAVCQPFQHRALILHCPWIHKAAICFIWLVSAITTAASSLAIRADYTTCNYYGAFDKMFLFFAVIFGIFVLFLAIIVINIKVFYSVRAHEVRFAFSADQVSYERRQSSDFCHHDTINLSIPKPSKKKHSSSIRTLESYGTAETSVLLTAKAEEYADINEYTVTIDSTNITPDGGVTEPPSQGLDTEENAYSKGKCSATRTLFGQKATQNESMDRSKDECGNKTNGLNCSHEMLKQVFPCDTAAVVDEGNAINAIESACSTSHVYGFGIQTWRMLPGHTDQICNNSSLNFQGKVNIESDSSHPFLASDGAQFRRHSLPIAIFPCSNSPYCEIHKNTSYPLRAGVDVRDPLITREQLLWHSFQNVDTLERGLKGLNGIPTTKNCSPCNVQGGFDIQFNFDLKSTSECNEGEETNNSFHHCTAGQDNKEVAAYVSKTSNGFASNGKMRDGVSGSSQILQLETDQLKIASCSELADITNHGGRGDIVTSHPCNDAIPNVSQAGSTIDYQQTSGIARNTPNTSCISPDVSDTAFFTDTQPLLESNTSENAEHNMSPHTNSLDLIPSPRRGLHLFGRHRSSPRRHTKSQEICHRSNTKSQLKAANGNLSTAKSISSLFEILQSWPKKENNVRANKNSLSKDDIYLPRVVLDEIPFRACSQHVFIPQKDRVQYLSCNISDYSDAANKNNSSDTDATLDKSTNTNRRHATIATSQQPEESRIQHTCGQDTRVRSKVSTHSMPDRARKMSCLTRQTYVSTKVARTVTLVCASFILAWLPFFVVIIYNTFCAHCDLAYALNAVLMVAFGQSASNPIIYALCHASFRRAYESLLNNMCLKASTYAS